MIENIDFQKLWDNRFPIIKIIGVVFLIIYLIFAPFSFELIWLLMALLLSFGAVLLYLLTIVTFQKELDRTVLQKSEENKLSEYPWTKYLVSAEDGVFLLPLFIIGINPVTVLITTVLYSAYHYSNFPRTFLYIRGVAYFMVGLWILPYGIWSVLFSHIIVDVIIAAGLPKWLGLGEIAE